MPRGAGGAAERVRPASHRPGLFSHHRLQSWPGGGADQLRHAHGLWAPLYGAPAGEWAAHHALASSSLGGVHDRLGAGIAVRAFVTTGIDFHNLSKEKLGPFLFIGGVGLLLGMRHSTDPDHVVAVSAIVSKQRSIRQAGLIGTIWGLGHTLTIFAVGSMIILFGVVIPPRLGLSMEFSVALMLILLGVLNLTGVMQRMTSYLTRNGKPLAKSRNVDRPLRWPLRRLSMCAAFGHRHCSRPGRIGSGCPAGSIYHPQSGMGDGLLVDFWRGHDGGHDVHDRGDGSAACLCGKPLCQS